MERIAAVIENGKVVNRIVVDGAFLQFAKNKMQLVEVTELETQPGIGWLYDGENFTDPDSTESVQD